MDLNRHANGRAPEAGLPQMMFPGVRECVCVDNIYIYIYIYNIYIIYIYTYIYTYTRTHIYCYIMFIKTHTQLHKYYLAGVDDAPRC